MPITHNFELSDDYFQFYICCLDRQGVAVQWTPDDNRLGFSTLPGFLAIATIRNMDVPVDIVIHDAAPITDLSAWDHVVESDFMLASGTLIVAGCTDYAPDAARLTLVPGTYRARICAGGFSTLSEDGLDGDDRYRLDLWPSAPSGPLCLKRSHPEGPRRS